jgi:hypothetical protein
MANDYIGCTLVALLQCNLFMVNFHSGKLIFVYAPVRSQLSKGQ